MTRVAQRPAVPAAAPQQQPSRRDAWYPAAEVAVFAAAAVLLLVTARGMWFIADEWNVLLNRRDLGVATLLAPHNEHWLTFPVLIYRALLPIAGLSSYWPFLLVSLALHTAASVAAWATLRRLGVPRVPAVLAGATLLLLGAAWEQLFTAFQLSWTAPTVLFLAALALLDHRGPRSDAGAALCLALAMPFGGVAIAFTLGTGAALIWRRQFRRAALVTVPALALYGTWRAVWGVSPPVDLTVVARLPGYVAHGVVVAVSAFTGLPFPLAAGVTALLAGAVAVALVRGRLGVTPLAALAALAAFYGTAGLARLPTATAEQAGSSRYLYLGALLLVIPAGAVLAGRWTRSVTVAASAVALLCLAASGATLVRESRVVRAQRGELAVHVMAADALLRAGLPFVPFAQPAPGHAPDISAARLVALREDAIPLAYRGPSVTTPDVVAEQRLRLQVSYQPVDDPPASADAAVTRADGEFGAAGPGCAAVSVPPGGSVSVDSTSGELALRGQPRSAMLLRRDDGSEYATDLGGSGTGVLGLAVPARAAEGTGLTMSFPGGADLTLCGRTLTLP